MEGGGVLLWPLFLATQNLHVEKKPSELSPHPTLKEHTKIVICSR